MLIIYESNYVDYVELLFIILMKRQYKNSFPQIFIRIAVLKSPQDSWENIFNKTSNRRSFNTCAKFSEKLKFLTP